MSITEREQPGRSPQGPASRPAAVPAVAPPRPDDRAVPVRVPEPTQRPRPVRTPVAAPTLIRPTGPPVAPLTQFGYWGDIQHFNESVQQAHQSYVAVNGVPPDPKTLLRLATSPPQWQQGPPLPVPADRSDARLLLRQLVTAGVDDKTYEDFVQLHTDVLSDMLKDPATHGQTVSAFSAARAHLSSVDVGPSTFMDALGAVGHAVRSTWESGGRFEAKVQKPESLVWAAHTAVALDHDLRSSQQAIMSGDRKKQEQANAFPHLTAAAPAVAQVVKGLVYSPAGIALTAVALAKDSLAFNEYVKTGGRRGSASFQHTGELAKQTGEQMWADLQDPSGHAGYLLLDAWGLLSLGAGTAARLGRVGSALAEEGGVGSRVAGAARASVSQHPLPTATYSKGGYTETISMSGSPLTAWIQKHTPVLGSNAQAAKLAGETRRVPALSDPLSQWASNLLSPESRIGRAGSIRRSTETKALGALSAKVHEAAGWAGRQTLMDRVIPGDWPGGLTRGEVKAIQALSWDDPNPIAAETRFHRDMIEMGVGDVKAHREQIANLALAADALKNPSPRFRETLDATVRAVAQAEKLRLERGLTTEVAEQRIAKAGAVLRSDEIVKLPEGGQGVKIAGADGKTIVVPLNRATNDSWYTPTVLKGKPPKRVGANTKIPISDYGISPPTLPIFENHRMDGAALRVGDIRIDAHNLAAEGLGRTVKAAVQWDGYLKAWEHATEAPTSNLDIPIRDVRAIPDHIRRSVLEFQDGQVSNQAAADLPADLQQHLFPEDHQITPDEHVRYIDPRLLGDLVNSAWDARWKSAEPAIGGLMGPINNALRPLILYGPKYILNLLGNGAMLAFDQGFIRSGANLAKAMSAKDNMVADDYAILQRITGSGKSESYVTTRSGRASKALAEFWSGLTDNHMRQASWLHYAERAGFHGWDQIHELMTNPEHAQTLTDVSKRADDAMVAFDRMNPFEKSILRNFIFVYPWQRGAFIWSFRSLFEHPAKTALLAALGQEAYTDDTWLKQVPGWIRQTGYIPFHWQGDKVGVLNPTSINTWSTLAQLLGTAKGVVEGDQYASVGDLFGPGGQLLVHATTGVDQNGNPYKGSQFLGAVEDTFNMVPVAAAFRRNQKGTGKALPPYNIASRSALLTRLSAALKQTALDPGWLGGFGSQLAGGFSPRELNLTAAAARYWIHATPAQRQQHELDLTVRQLALQAQFMKTGMPTDAEVTRMMLAPLGSVNVKGQIPPDVYSAALDASRLARANAEAAKKLGRNQTAKEQLLTTISYFQKQGKFSGTVGKQLRDQANGLEAQPDISHMLTAVHTKYGNLVALQDWSQDVSLAASFLQPANVDARTALLSRNGLSSKAKFKLSGQERAAYGRAFVGYMAGRRSIARKLTGTAQTVAIRAYDDAHSSPYVSGPGDFKDETASMRSALSRLGAEVGKVNIISGFRSEASQTALWDASVAAGHTGTMPNGNPIARPQSRGGAGSDHSRGIAADGTIMYHGQSIPLSSLPSSVLAKYGLTTVPGDVNHVMLRAGGGRVLPSLAALQLSNGPTDVAQQNIIRGLNKPWRHLTIVEKQALGRMTPLTVSKGWDYYERSVIATRAANGIVHKKDREIIAAKATSLYPGFGQDYAYSQTPRVYRFLESPAYQAIPERSIFDKTIGIPAAQVAQSMANGDYLLKDMRHSWNVYINQLLPVIRARNPQLGDWLQPLGNRWLTGLINSG